MLTDEYGSRVEAVIDCVVNHPREGEPSFPQWKAEKDAVLASLKVID